MNTAVKCFVLLACVTCTSQAVICCRCIKTAKVRPSLIVDVVEYGPGPYCKKHEVIATLRDGTLRCLEPKHKLTQAILQKIKVRNEAHAANMNKTRSATTTATTTTSAPASALASLAHF